MNSLIHPNQTAYVLGRVIFDNIIRAQETLFQVKRNKTKGILLKIDLEKTFDRQNWDFLEEVL